MGRWDGQEERRRERGENKDNKEKQEGRTRRVHNAKTASGEGGKRIRKPSQRDGCEFVYFVSISPSLLPVVSIVGVECEAAVHLAHIRRRSVCSAADQNEQVQSS